MYRVSRFITEGALLDGSATVSAFARHFVSSGRSIDAGTGIMLMAGLVQYLACGTWRSGCKLYACRWMHTF